MANGKKQYTMQDLWEQSTDKVEFRDEDRIYKTMDVLDTYGRNYAELRKEYPNEYSIKNRLHRYERDRKAGNYRLMEMKHNLAVGSDEIQSLGIKDLMDQVQDTYDLYDTGEQIKAVQQREELNNQIRSKVIERHLGKQAKFNKLVEEQVPHKFELRREPVENKIMDGFLQQDSKYDMGE